MLEAGNGETYKFVFLQGLDVDAVGVVNAAIDFNDTNALSTGLLEERSAVETDVAESLNDESLAGDAGGESDLASPLLAVDKVFNTVENTLKLI